MRQDCYNVPDKRCRYETLQNCNKVPYQDCQQVPKQQCHDVHKQVPKQVERTVCEGDKGWSAASSSTDIHHNADSGSDGYIWQ